jgi:hypothetical protein
MCLRRAPEKYIAGAALDRAALGVSASSYTTSNPSSLTLYWLLCILRPVYERSYYV